MNSTSAQLGIRIGDLFRDESVSGREASGFCFQERIDFLEAHGRHSMSFSGLQPDMSYFDVAGVGYIAFRKHWGTVVCLGDPVCAPEDQDQLLDLFFEKYPSPAFIQVSPGVAMKIHEKKGYYATQFGRETTLDLAEWTLSGKKKQVLRTAVNRAKNEKIQVRESRGDEAYRHLSDAWLKTRRCKGREIVFLIRPMEMAFTRGTRRFFAYRNNELIGFIFFDPVYENGRVKAYVPNVSRASQAFPQGIFYLLMVKAFERFKAEGVPQIFLGLSPLHWIIPCPPLNPDPFERCCPSP